MRTGNTLASAAESALEVGARPGAAASRLADRPANICADNCDVSSANNVITERNRVMLWVPMDGPTATRGAGATVRRAQSLLQVLVFT